MIRRLSLAALAALTFAAPSFAAHAVRPAAPTEKRPVADTLWGVKVHEDYRWLESWSDPAVRAWSEAQNARTRGYLDSLPDRPAIAARLQELTRSIAPSYRGLTRAGDWFFAIKDQPPREQPFLVRLTSVDDTASARVVFDPTVFDSSGHSTMDFFVPSHDGSKVAISISAGGTESGSVYVFDCATGAQIGEPVPRVNGGTAGGGLAWNADGSGFFRTRYPAPGERPESDLAFYQQVYFHRLGTPDAQDTPVLTHGLPKIAEIALSGTDDGTHVIAHVENGDGGQYAFYLLDAAGGATKICGFADGIVVAHAAADGIYLLSQKRHGTREILRVPYATPTLAHASRVIAASPRAAIENFAVTPSAIYTRDILGGPSRVRVFTHRGVLRGSLPLGPVEAVTGFCSGGDGTLLVQRESFTTPSAWWRYTPRTKRLTRTQLEERSPATFAGVEVLRAFARSKDGTRVPMSILLKAGTKLDGHNPTLLTGYGGYGISRRPRFRAETQAWLEQGGIFVTSHIRGGGEYGEAWHRAGNLTKKQHVFDDFIACAEYLIREKFTSPQHLAIEGGSNGGLLMGVVMVQRPELFRAVLSHVGIYDMLRVELTPNGEFNTTEFGTVKKRDEFRALYAYSPIHHVRDRVAYPATMFTTGQNDPRVDPANSRKMTARLQAVPASLAPVLLRTSSTTGHGGGSPYSARIALSADGFGFLFDQLGVKYQKPAEPAQ